MSQYENQSMSTSYKAFFTSSNFDFRMTASIFFIMTFLWCFESKKNSFLKGNSKYQECVFTSFGRIKACDAINRKTEFVAEFDAFADFKANIGDTCPIS